MASLRQLDFRCTYDLSYLNAFLAGRSYIRDNTFSSTDSDLWTQWHEQKVGVPSSDRYPHAYRWFVHINALMRLKNAEPLVMIGGSGTNHTIIKDRKRRHSGEKSSLSQLKKETRERAARRETAPFLFTIQIRFRTKNDAELQDSQKLWEKVKQTALPKEMTIKWGQFGTWMPSEKNSVRSILQTTFVSRVSTTDPAMTNADNVIRLILQSHPDDVECCEIISQKAL